VQSSIGRLRKRFYFLPSYAKLASTGPFKVQFQIRAAALILAATLVSYTSGGSLALVKVMVSLAALVIVVLLQKLQNYVFIKANNDVAAIKRKSHKEAVNQSSKIMV
jgi:hypothetical protein